MNMGYFRVPYLLDGPSYPSWLTATTAFVLMFVYGMWSGLIYRRAGLPGTTIFRAARLGAPALAAIITTWVHGWTDIGRLVTVLTAAGLTGVLAGAVMLAGGFATIRRLTM
jgi:hypothetical protein